MVSELGAAPVPWEPASMGPWVHDVCMPVVVGGVLTGARGTTVPTELECGADILRLYFGNLAELMAICKDAVKIVVQKLRGWAAGSGDRGTHGKGRDKWNTEPVSRPLGYSCFLFALFKEHCEQMW